MRSNDFSIRFLEMLAADMRQVQAARSEPMPRSYSAMTLVSGLVALLTMRLV